VHYDNNYNFSIYENGKEIALIGRNVPIIVDKSSVSGTNLNFRPPLFGITTLGSGHGFDPNSETSGLIIWINRRGVMIDPPVNSTEKLLSLGVSPKLIDNIILTHCHADHDAGTLQKILQDGKVNLYTTSTIFKSFIKKSEALTGLEENRLKQLVNFYPVIIGKQMIIAGGRFNFSYTLHSIPTISIEASLSGKNMIYSSDTMNDPTYINKLFDDQILTKNRRDFLINFPWHKDVIFHEAGMPPIHTPISYLCSLQREIRERMYLVHVSQDLIPKESGLKIAPTGVVNTLELDIIPLLHDEALEKLDAFAHIELFENLTFKKARELLLVSEVNHYNASDVIFRKGDRGDKFYVVISGEVDIILDSKIITTYGMGGYFGEKSIFLDENRSATAIAKTQLKLLSIQKDEMLSLIRGTESEYMLRQIADFQTTELRETLHKNKIIASLTATQQTQLHGLIKPLANYFSVGDVVADKYSTPKFTHIIREGNIDVCQDNDLIDTLTEGELFGVACLFSENNPNNFSFIAKNNVRLYYIEHSDLKKYLDQNPGAFIKMSHIIY
jgi:CRP-like cAMP-binding protein